MANSTSYIQNNEPNSSVVASVLISNNDLTIVGIVELEIFITVGGSLFAIVHELFSIPPLVTEIRNFDIAGASSFEIQYNVLNTPDVIVNIFSTDAAGILNAAQRVLNSEIQMIS
ncbi:hypothetical protein ACWHAM_14580 [Paenibacillus terrae]